jgi:hypothetical protein
VIKTRNHEATVTSGRETDRLKLAVNPSKGWGASHRAVTKVNVYVASKNLTTGSRARHIMAKVSMAAQIYTIMADEYYIGPI